MALPPPFTIDPPLLNSASPWAPNYDNIRDLYNCPSTGAVTLRTSLLKGFDHDPSIHQYTFFSPTSASATARVSTEGKSEVLPGDASSLNTLGYSPISLSKYLNMITCAAEGLWKEFTPTPDKPFIISVTGTADEVAECYLLITEVQINHPNTRLMMEINLSCPNIPDKPPPAYDASSLATYLSALAQVRGTSTVLSGIKTPPYTYQNQYVALISALETSTHLLGGCPISFITATNTLGSCLVLRDGSPALKSASGEGIGGMAGSSLHPLALGNVATIRKMLDARDSLRHIEIIGVGGVSNNAGFKRMKGVGAAAVGVGTALGREGVDVFEKIMKG